MRIFQTSDGWKDNLLSTKNSTAGRYYMRRLRSGTQWIARAYLTVVRHLISAKYEWLLGVLIVCVGIFQAPIVWATQAHEDEWGGLWTLRSEMRSDEQAEFLFLYRPGTNLFHQWRLFVDSADKPVAMGDLPIDSALIPLRVRIRNTGEYIPILSLFYSNKCVAAIKGGSIVVGPPQSVEILQLAVGPIAGAIIAVAVFLLQEVFNTANARRRRRSELRARLRIVAQRLLNSIQTDSGQGELPDWLSLREGSEWTPFLAEAEFLSTFEVLEEISRAVNAKLEITLDQREELRRLAGRSEPGVDRQARNRSRVR